MKGFFFQRKKKENTEEKMHINLSRQQANVFFYVDYERIYSFSFCHLSRSFGF